MYHAFCKLGGRPSVLVIDQDAVFVAKETYGEVIETRTFGDFCTEQELKLWVCKKADPESKGPIENSVGFVKKNFFSARNICSIDDVWKALPGWLERKNKRIHQATFHVPIDVFNEIEKQALRPLILSAYETSPSSYIPYELHGQPYVQYKSCKYSVPREYSYMSSTTRQSEPSYISMMRTGSTSALITSVNAAAASSSLMNIRNSLLPTG
jgi:hypothetical protein